MKSFILSVTRKKTEVNGKSNRV